jgi:chromosome segregation ATPase
MAEKKIYKIPRSADARDRYFGVLLEDINGKLSLLLEGYRGLDTRIGKLEERIEILEEKIDRLEVRLDNIEERLDNLERKFEVFRIETNEKFAALFDGQQQFFEEMRQFHLRIEVLEGKS